MLALLALVLALFTVPVSSVFADGYDIADGEYEIGVEALDEDTDEKSGADGFLLDKATLSITGNNIEIELGYTKDFEMEYGINWTKLEGADPITEDENDKGFYYTFSVSDLKKEYKAGMNYYVPGMPGDMGDEDKGHSVTYRIVLDEDDLSNLPEATGAEEGNGDNGEGTGEENDETNGDGNSDTEDETNGDTNDNDNGEPVAGDDQEDNPQTGNSSNMGLYISLLVAAVAVAGIVVFARKRSVQ